MSSNNSALSIDASVSSSSEKRWTMEPGLAISWNVPGYGKWPHEDTIEMNGRSVAQVLHYGVDQSGNLVLQRHIVWPTLRTLPNTTKASLSHDYGMEVNPKIFVNGGRVSSEKPQRFILDGLLTIISSTSPGLKIVRTLFPARYVKAALERMTLRNMTDHPMKIELEFKPQIDLGRGGYGVYVMEVLLDAPKKITINPGEKVTFGLIFSGRGVMENPIHLDVVEEEAKRRQFVETIVEPLRFESPDPMLNRAFDFAKIRTTEAVFETRGGLMHCPGGSAYYAAVWCNDQVEYAGPFFPFLGEKGANDALLNTYRLFRPFMGSDYSPIPPAIISEGHQGFGIAGDRGDAAMYAYGAARYVLARGDRKIAEELFPAIEWCLEYCKRQMTADGVIASDSDELEGRFPTGRANLSTSCLTYGGLCSAADLARSLGESEKAEEFRKSADLLAQTIESYFGAVVEGFDTYRYYEGNDVLRSWICLPLTMGLMNRREGTIAALFSPQMWTQDGLATISGGQTFWDRSTLYALRGVFFAGETEKAMACLEQYTKRRFSGEHVPYPVEAGPGGGQRHLSSESALYCRIITEGIFGIVPTGLTSFQCTPRLPTRWNEMALRSIRAMGGNFDIKVMRKENKLNVVIENKDKTVCDQIIAEGEVLSVNLALNKS